MQASADLQKIAFPVEAAVCTLDRERRFELQDVQVVEIFEILLDIYAFGGLRETVSPRVDALHCGSVLDLVDRELRPCDRAIIAGVLGTIRHVACRRAAGGRHHIEIFHRYCGSFDRTGVGLRILDDGTEMAVGEI
jgi:hypothetical protein